MKNQNLTQSQKNLIKKYETAKKPKGQTGFTKDKKEMYLTQTDRNYKDGDRN